MTTYTFYIVFPDGDVQEIPAPLAINQLVDLNGIPLEVPLPTAKMIAYRVTGVRHREERGYYDVYCLVELVSAAELAEFVGKRGNTSFDR